MRIFVAGATGTLGRPVVRELVSHGHDVVGLTRTECGRQLIDATGARGVVGNALDGDGLRGLVSAARPDQIVHLLTALPPAGVLRASALRPTNALRVSGTANLLRAALESGVRRVVAESFVGVYGIATFADRRSEDLPLPPVEPGAFSDAVVALRRLEEQLRSAGSDGRLETVALRIGLLYGPDVSSTDVLIKQARAGRLFVPRGLSGIGAFVHIADATSALVAAIERPRPSLIYNIVDDEPMALEQFLQLLTRSIGARPPRGLPHWLVKIAAPVMAQMGNARLLLSNEKAKRELGWSLRYPTVHAGLPGMKHTAEAA